MLLLYQAASVFVTSSIVGTCQGLVGLEEDISLVCKWYQTVYG